MRHHRLAIIATHPIQYYAPLFRLLTERSVLSCHVFYGWTGTAFGAMEDTGFGRRVEWDIPLLDGYEFTFVPNESKNPGTHHWNGIKSSRLLPLLRGWSPDAVLVYGWNFSSHLGAMRRLHGRTPILFRGDSTLLDERIGPRRLLRRGLLRYVYSHVDIGLYVGTRNREYLQRHGLEERQLLWAPHSVDNDRFFDANGRYEQSAAEWRRELGVNQGDKVVLFAGKLQPKKAPDLLLKVFLRQSAANEHLFIVGSGALETQLRMMAAGNTRVHFLGFQNQSAMPIVYRLGDVFVLPSRGPGETWGLAVNEAMASGRPVIVSDRVGCAPDLVVGEQTGLAFQSEDEHELARTLVHLLRDAALRQRMGACALKTISKWSFASQVAALEAAVAYAVASV